MKKIFKISQIIAIIIISYFIFYNITSEFLNLFFQGLYELGQYIYIFIYVGQTIILYILSNLLFDNSSILSPLHRKLLWTIYFLVMTLLLFGRSYLGQNLNLNLLELFNFEFSNLSQILLNFLLFLPMGYWIKKYSFIKALVITLIFVFSIELIQLITHRGIFDIVDIVIDSLSIITSYFVLKNIKFKQNI